MNSISMNNWLRLLMNALKLILVLVLNRNHQKLKVTSREIKNSWDRGSPNNNSNSNSKKHSENSKLSKLKLSKSNRKDNRSKLECFNSSNKNGLCSNNSNKKLLRDRNNSNNQLSKFNLKILNRLEAETKVQNCQIIQTAFKVNHQKVLLWSKNLSLLILVQNQPNLLLLNRNHQPNSRCHTVQKVSPKTKKNNSNSSSKCVSNSTCKKFETTKII